MDHNLTELLSEVPDDIFFDDKGAPNYNAVFVEIVRCIYRHDTSDFMIPSSDFLAGKLPNLSTFQRTVGNERLKREGTKSGPEQV